MQWKAEERKLPVQSWISPPHSTTGASLVATQEIVKRGKPFTDGEYIKESFRKISEYLFSDSKNKWEIALKIKDILLSTKPLEDCAIKMAANICSKSKSMTSLQLKQFQMPVMTQVMQTRVSRQHCCADMGRSDTEVTLNRWEQKHLRSYNFSEKKQKPLFQMSSWQGLLVCSCATVQLAEQRTWRGQGGRRWEQNATFVNKRSQTPDLEGCQGHKWKKSELSHYCAVWI